MSELSTYIFPSTSGRIRVVDIADCPWFSSSDLATQLDLADVRTSLRSLDDDETVRHTMPGTDIMEEFVSESGMYSLILRSRRPEAKEFKRWITREVIPQIRKTGSYSNTPKSFAEALQLAADSQREIERQAAQLAITGPKANAYDGHIDADGGVTIRALAKQLIDDGYQVTCKGMYETLHTIKVIYKQGETWVPYEPARKEGIAISRWDICADGRVREIALITPAGVLKIRDRLAHLRKPGNSLTS